MLIREPKAMRSDQILAMISAVRGGSEAEQVHLGVYQISHFGGSHFLDEYDHYPDTAVGPYGVCDTVEQLLAACPELEAPGREFVVTVTAIRKADEPPQGGWRWHKWGEYIGTQTPQCEYIYDEPNIEEVLCFHIYERVRGDKALKEAGNDE